MSAFRRIMSYLGLVDDDDYADEYTYGYDDPARASVGARPTAEPDPATGGIRPMSGPMGADSGMSSMVTPQRSSVVRPILPLPSAKPHTVTPATFDDCKEIGDRLKAGVPVILNLETIDRDLLRRIVDFASGLSYGVGAEMGRTADRVYLLTPTGRA